MEWGKVAWGPVSVGIELAHTVDATRRTRWGWGQEGRPPSHHIRPHTDAVTHSLLLTGDIANAPHR